jgi:hypothetical protein
MKINKYLFENNVRKKIFLYIFQEIYEKYIIIYYKMSSSRELQHRDWLLYSTKKIIQSIDQNVSVDIIERPNNTKVLVASGINQESIDKLIFLVNTDQNNNYLYLEDFQVYIIGAYSPLDIPGFNETCMNIFRASDIDGFLLGNKTHNPFNPINFQNSTFKGTTFSQFVDEYSGLLPYTADTFNETKTYQITLNPDLPTLENRIRRARASKEITHSM